MGTRNLTMVQFNNEIKVAQYGQWDGYPSGQGVTVLEFCSNATNLVRLKERLLDVSFLEDQNEINRLNELIEQKDLKTLEWYDMFYSRNVCADILMNIIMSNGKIKLRNTYNFGYNGLYCEWAYLINFDTNKLEVYCGGSKVLPLKSERFYKSEPNDDGYYGIRLIKEYDFADLPDVDTFITDLEDNNDGQ